MRVEIWSDVVCPWCYIGKRRFEAALSRFEHRDAVEVVWRSFELDPSAPAERTEATVDYLAKKYRMTRAQAQAAEARVSDLAKAEGLSFDLSRTRSGNTFPAHRLIHLACRHGKQDALKERLLAAYFCEGRRIGDHATLAALAAEVGLDAGEVDAALAGDAFADEVRADEAEARENGISGVPFFLVDRRYAISGAQPTEVFEKALARAWSDGREQAVAEAPGASCGDDACDV